MRIPVSRWPGDTIDVKDAPSYIKDSFSKKNIVKGAVLGGGIAALTLHPASRGAIVKGAKVFKSVGRIPH